MSVGYLGYLQEHLWVGGFGEGGAGLGVSLQSDHFVSGLRVSPKKVGSLHKLKVLC